MTEEEVCGDLDLTLDRVANQTLKCYLCRWSKHVYFFSFLYHSFFNEFDFLAQFRFTEKCKDSTKNSHIPCTIFSHY